jgi:cyclic beta-1,2-glucan synthetase
MKPNPHLPTPHARLLSNGRYHVFISAAGTGQSRRHGHVVNRWSGDPVEDGQGQFIYLRDLHGGATWSVAMQPVKVPGEAYESSDVPGIFSIVNECEGIRARLDVAVSPGDDLEVRRLHLRNFSGRPRRIEVTSFLEAVLTWQGADLGHPAFSKLFVQTSCDAANSMLLAERRPRGADETWPCLFHSLAGASATGWETDRLRFIGRGRDMSDPRAMEEERLSGTVGNVLDPCLSLRVVLDFEVGEERELGFVTGIAETREAAAEMAKRHRFMADLDRVLHEAGAAELELQGRLGLDPAEAARIQSLAAAMYYGCRSLVPDAGEFPVDADANDFFGKQRIPRDRPQVVVAGPWDSGLTRELLRARGYWNHKVFFTNLIVLANSAAKAPEGLDDRVFTIPAASLSDADRALLFASASAVVKDRFPDLTGNHAPGPPPEIKWILHESSPAKDPEPLQFFNGHGGFSADGSEYVIRLPRGGERPPMPWINVVANEAAGFLVSESGAGCTWARNSQANRITPWSNEPAGDLHGEALYLRDEKTGAVWSPLPGPVPGSCDYEVRHGFGATRFLSSCHGIDQEVTVFVPRVDPVKITHLRLGNHSKVAKHLCFASFQRLVMGSLAAQPSLIVTRQEEDGSLRAVNPAAGDFLGGVAFGATSLSGAEVERRDFTCDRLAFLGRHGTPRNPAGLRNGGELGGECGAGLDPCFAERRTFTLEPGGVVEIVVLLGEATGEAEAARLNARYRDPSVVKVALTEARGFWKSLLGGVKVTTPSPVMNLMVNGWLAYQTLCCRMWARSAFYQSSGAFGYRDQLQDSGSLLPLDPSFARRQILLHARHQFVEGDVLHWWHPEPIERGLRTRFSDDLLWLPLVTADYVLATGDHAVLDEREPYLTAPLLEDGHDENYLTPEPSGEDGSLYDHCCRAIDRSLVTGAHGLPLMGTGDWNDGMSRVGREGKGESVWMGFFLYRILGKFIPLCEARGDGGRAAKYEEHRSKLRSALNEGGWDGEWYRRAYYDNGAPLGSKDSDECKIDALAQAWAVLSKAAPPERAELALAAMSRELISEEEGLIRLLTPPFVNTANDPGYIKGYVAGVRENGGQYTHAACWAVQSIAEHGENNRALRLWEMLTPISHSLTPEAAELYKVEPYAVAADIYGAEPHIGRGGWTWYTGSSGWMYRVAIESILGLRVEDGATLVIEPCIPDDWPSFVIQGALPDGSASYRVTVENPGGKAKRVLSAERDGVKAEVVDGTARIPLPRDGGFHEVRVTIGVSP